MNIHAMARERALQLKPHPTCALISVSTPGMPYPRPIRLHGWMGYLTFGFSDVAHSVPFEGDPYTRFNLDMAQQIVSAVNRWQANGCEDLVIHCDKGQSRSVGIAEALRHAGVGPLRLWDCHHALGANELVLRRMREALNPAPKLQW